MFPYTVQYIGSIVFPSADRKVKTVPVNMPLVVTHRQIASF